MTLWYQQWHWCHHDALMPILCWQWCRHYSNHLHTINTIKLHKWLLTDSLFCLKQCWKQSDVVMAIMIPWYRCYCFRLLLVSWHYSWHSILASFTASFLILWFHCQHHHLSIIVGINFITAVGVTASLLALASYHLTGRLTQKNLCQPHFIQVPYLSLAYMRDVIPYMCHIYTYKTWTWNVTKRTAHIFHKVHFILLPYITGKNMATTLATCHSPHSTSAYISKKWHIYVPKHNQLPHLLCMLLPYMCRKHVCPPNWICMPYNTYL